MAHQIIAFAPVSWLCREMMRRVSACGWMWLAVAIAVGLRADDTAAPTDTEPVALPSFEVLGKRPWLYAEFADVRLLSLASAGETQRFIEVIQDFQELYRQLIPAAENQQGRPLFQVVLKVPLFESMVEARGFKPTYVETNMRLHRNGDLRIHVFPEVPPRVHRFRSQRSDSLTDESEHVIATEEQWADVFCDSYLRRLLEAHGELPEWYRTGLQYTRMRLRRDTFPIGVYNHSIIGFTVSARTHAEKSKKGKMVLELWPLRRFLGVTCSSPDRKTMSPEERELYRNQAQLFLHWGLWGDGKAHRAGFFRLVSAAGNRPVDDALFQQCFGFRLEEGQERFERFARKQVGDVGHWKTVGVSAPDGRLNFLISENLRRERRDRVEVRPARGDEVVNSLGEVYLWNAARFRDVAIERWRGGDYWATIGYQDSRRENGERLILRNLWNIGSMTAPQRAMLERAERVLGRSSETEPEVSARLGLLQIAKGNNPEAIRLLSVATEQHVQRADAYVELARLLLDDALRSSGLLAGDGALPTGFERVKELLREALKLAPDMWLAHHLLAYAWDCSGGTPDAQELEVLCRAARRNPEDGRMVLAVARLCERSGAADDAVALARIGRAWGELARVQSRWVVSSELRDPDQKQRVEEFRRIEALRGRPE